MSLSLTLNSGPSSVDGFAVIRDWLPALSALIAALAFVFSIWKQRSDARLQRELEAMRRWSAFMTMAFQNPSEAYKPDHCWRCKRVEGEARPQEDIKHKNFVANFLFTAEEVIEIDPNDGAWVETIKSQMNCHRHYFLEEMTSKQLLSYSKTLQSIICEWKSENKKPAGGGLDILPGVNH